MNKTRIRRIASELKKEISVLINQDLKDSRIAPITSITEIDLTDDLQSAKVYISVLGSQKEKEDTMKALEHSKGFIKKELGNRMNLRHIPQLYFILDEQLEKAMKMDKLISEVIKKDNEAIHDRQEE